MCFDFNNPESLERIESFWIKEIQDSKNRDKLAAMILVGCKSDLKGESAISDRMISVVKESKRVYFSSYASCSALEMDGLDDVFYNAAKFGCNAWM